MIRTPSTGRNACLRGVVALMLLLPRVAYAHPGQPIAPHDLWTRWTFAPVLLMGCAAASWLYLKGTRAARASRRRRSPSAERARMWRTGCYAVGWLTLLVALASPLDAVSAALFSAHMMQHLLLVMVAPPLFVLGDPLLVSLWGLPLSARRAMTGYWLRSGTLRSIWRAIASPGVAWPLHVSVLWSWHLPSLYGRALENEAVHVLEHATFFVTALLFWWVVLRPHGRRISGGVALIYLFGGALQSTMLGAALALARHPLYSAHFGTTSAWGLTPLEDQQLAGLLMWVPAGIVYLVALIPVALRVLRATPDQRSPALAIAGVSARGTP